jgi:hypothetical protein
MEVKMRTPVRSEGDAFRAVLVVAMVAGTSFLVGLLAGGAAAPVLGICLFVVGMGASLTWAIAHAPADSSLRDAAVEGDADRGPERVLLVVGDTPTPQQLEVLRREHPHAVLEVHSPVLQSRTHFVTTDIDRETAIARERLRETLGAASRVGIDATGEVGDPIDPLAGIKDQLRRHHVDEVFVATHPSAAANWVEAELLRRLRSELDRPLKHVEL